MTDEAPTTAALRLVLAGAAEVLIVETEPDEIDNPDAARIVVTGAGIAELGRLLAIVDGGTGTHCLCHGWPTIVVRDDAGRELDRWTLHHQSALRSVGNCDAELRDGPALTDWLADRGLTGSRRIQEMIAVQDAEREVRRAAWVRIFPPPLAEAAESASRREDGAEERLVELIARSYPDPAERIRSLLTWAGASARHLDGNPWYELAPVRMLMDEPVESVYAVLMSGPPTPEQLDGAADLVTSMWWTQSRRPVPPEPVRAMLVAHVTATGTDPMKFQMRHGYGA